MPTFKNNGYPTPPGLIVSVNTASFTGGGELIAAPGEEKEIVIMSVSSSNAKKLGTGTKGASTFLYMQDGEMVFPLGFAIGKNLPVTTDMDGSNYVTISYYVRDV